MGDHGFGLEAPEARTLLWLSGGPFKAGMRFDGAKIVDIAPTIADILGLSMPECDGRVLSETYKTTTN